MECEQMTIGDNGATIHSMNADIEIDNFDPDRNFDADGNEIGVIASTSNIVIETRNADEDIAATEETIDVRPIVQNVLSKSHSRKRSQKKKRTKASKIDNLKAMPKRFKCDQCDYRNAHESRIKAHAQVHSTEKPFQCEHCNERYGYVCNLIKHLIKRHNVILL